MMRKHKSTVNMDEKQRVCLSRALSKEEKDHWIYKDPKALASLMKGIKDAEKKDSYMI